MDPIRVFLTEDNADLSAALVAVLHAHDDIRCVGSATSIADLVSDARSAEAAVVVLDVELQGESGLRRLPELRERLPGVSFVIFTGHDHPEMRRAALSSGAAAYVVKSSGPESLVAAIRQAGQAQEPPAPG
jgi:DNA-binding NarL/FixJ family response regulator